MDDKLSMTIDKIVRLCKQNAEFDKELRKRLKIASSANAVCSDNGQISNIEKYLGLDYYVDGQPSGVDYSFVNNPGVRAQLVSDNREMMRFRYGTRYHKIDFYEFCRYAHLQVEMLLNYYYDVANKSDMEAIKQHIWKFNSNAMGVGAADTISGIPFNAKLWAFKSQYNVDFELYDNLRKVRNNLSHRSSSQDEAKFYRYQKMLADLGFHFRKNGDAALNWKDKDADKDLKNVYRSLKSTQEFKDYLHLAWCHSMPYAEVVEGVRRIAEVIRNELCIVPD